MLQAFFLTKTGNNAVQGHLYPASDDTYDLGTIERKWRFGYFDDVYARTLTAEHIRGISIRPNLLQNGGFEQTNAQFRNQPLGWEASDEVRLAEPMFSLMDDADYPTDTPEELSLLMLGAM